MPCKPQKFEKYILQIWSSSPIQVINTSAPIYWRWHVISANTIGLGEEEVLSKFAMLCLFVKTSPINFAGMGGNGNKEIYRETTRSNWKQPSIAIVPGWLSTIVSLPTHLFFRYHLPLRCKEGCLVWVAPPPPPLTVATHSKHGLLSNFSWITPFDPWHLSPMANLPHLDIDHPPPPSCP